MFNRLSDLLCLILPCTTMMFLISGPHASGEALVWTLPLWGLLIADWLSPDVTAQQTGSKASDKFYDGILLCLAFLQFINIGLMLTFVSRLQWDLPGELETGLVNLIVVRILVGTSSGSSAITVAHELIHRSQKSLQYLGRLLLCTVCYEHFAIAHQHGHHRSVGKPYDITTARQGESFNSYWKRVQIGYMRYAWHFEMDRLGIKQQPLRNFRIIHNRVLQSIVFQSLLVIVIWLIFGWLAALMFLYQAFTAIRLLETINYFQHWGLSEQQSGASLAWVNRSWITRKMLLSLSYHIDHHEHPSRHYQNINYSEQGPKMPYGYFVTNLWVKLSNSSYQRIAQRELKKFNCSLNA